MSGKSRFEMALQPKHAGEVSRITEALNALKEAVRWSRTAGIDEVDLRAIYRRMDAVFYSVDALDGHTFGEGAADASVVRAAAIDIDAAGKHLRMYYGSYFDSNSRQYEAIYRIKSAFDELKKHCQDKIRSRFSNFFLDQPQRLKKKKFVENFSKAILDRLDLIGFDEDEKGELWRALVSDVALHLASRLRVREEFPLPETHASAGPDLADGSGLDRGSGSAGDASESVSSFLQRVYGEVAQPAEASGVGDHAPSVSVDPPRVENKSGGPSPPSEAPAGEKYATHARAGEDAVDFIRRVYEAPGYLTGEFTRADLRKIDPSAVEALENWEKKTATRPKRRAPLNLPTLKELNDRLLQADPATLTHAERLAQKRLITMRKQGAKRSTEKLQLNR